MRWTLLSAFALLALLALLAIVGAAEAHHEVASTRLPTTKVGATAVWTGEEALVFGGWGGPAILRYDPATGALRGSNATLLTERAGAYSFFDGRHAYVVGGNTYYDETRRVTRYDPHSDTSTLLEGRMPQHRVFASGVYDGKDAYLFGGDIGTCSGHSSSILRYDVQNDTWRDLSSSVGGPKLPSGRAHTAAVFDGRYAYVFGGSTVSVSGTSCVGSTLDEILRFDPQTGELQVLDTHLPWRRAGMSAVWDGQYAWIYSGSHFCRDTLRFDPTTGTIVTFHDLMDCRTEAASVWTGERTYIFGGHVSYLRDADTILMHPAPDAPPSEPQRVTAGAGLGDGEIALRWDAPRHDGNLPVTRYHVLATRAGGSEEHLGSVTSTSFVHAGLAQGETVSYRVIAENALGESAASASATGHAPREPDAPRSPRGLSGPDRGLARVLWSAPLDDGGRPIQAFRVYRDDGSGWALLGETSAGFFNDTERSDGAVARYRVTAVNALGESAPSATIEVRAPTVPSAPRGVSFVSGPGRGNVTVSWTRPLDAGGNAVVVSHRVYRDGVLLYDTGNDLRWSLTFVDTGREDGASATYRVVSLNVVGEGPAVEKLAAAPALPSAPDDLQALAGSRAGTVLLRWRAPTSSGGVALDGYAVDRIGPDALRTRVAVVPSAAVGYVDAPGVGVATYEVRALNVVGEGPRATASASAAALVATGGEAFVPLGVGDESARDVTIRDGGRVHFVLATGTANPRSEDTWFDPCFSYSGRFGQQMKGPATFTVAFQYDPAEGRLLASTTGDWFYECSPAAATMTPTSATLRFVAGAYYDDTNAGVIRILAT